jgi:hypothetical protein
MITTPGHSLTFGSVDLLGDRVTTAGGYWLEAAGADANFGNPEPVEKAITSFLQDGAIASIESFDNREMSLKITIYGVDSAGLAAGEAALIGEVAKRNILTWTPPDISGDFAGASSVFDVVTSWLDHSFNDINELNLQRTYTLTIKALPFARSTTKTTLVSPAPPNTSPTVTTINNASSTTNWTAPTSSDSPTPTVVGGTSVRVSVTNSTGSPVTKNLNLRLSGLTLTTATSFYVRLDFSTSTPATVKFNTTPVTPTATNGTVGWYYWPAGNTTITNINIEIPSTTVAPANSLTITVNDVSKSDMAQDAAGQRQTFRSLTIAGSARTQGNLVLADPATGLGSVLVYTAPNSGSVAQPPLRTYRTAGSTETTDTSTVSGKTSDLATLHAFDIPAPLVPTAGYLLMARVKHTTGATYNLTWAARAKVSSTTLTSATDPTGTQAVTIPAATWTVVVVAAMVLPVRRLDSAGYVRIELTGVSGLLLDEAWLFNVETGQLTWVECGTGTPTVAGPKQRLFLDAASLDSPVPSVWVGNAADRSDSFGAATEMASFDEHEFVPPLMNIFTVTGSSVATEVTLSYYPRAHTHVIA